MRTPAWLLAAGLVLIAVATAPQAGGAQSEAPPTFSETIAPIVYRTVWSVTGRTDPLRSRW